MFTLVTRRIRELRTHNPPFKKTPLLQSNPLWKGWGKSKEGKETKSDVLSYYQGYDNSLLTLEQLHVLRD